MDHFHYQNNELYVEEIPVTEVAARWGTPLYIYSRATLERHVSVFKAALAGHPHQICYAVKANSNVAILNLLARLGCGFDIVSQGELERVLVAGGNPQKIVFSGVGKLVPELERALEVGIGCFNLESEAELFRLNDVAQRLGKMAKIAFRVNPNISVTTHPYIATGLKENKFGVEISTALGLFREAQKLSNIEIVGVGYHIGSQLTDVQPFVDAFDRVHELVNQLANEGITLKHLDIGGGLGVRYDQENPPSPQEYLSSILARLPNKNLEILIEPGRSIVANAGILTTRVEYLKKTSHKNFAVVDAAMNDLLRPSLYQAYQAIVPIAQSPGLVEELWDVVGPICETGDFLGKNRMLALKENDLLAIRTAGAYGFTMSSNYNSRPRAAEVLVDGNQMYCIRRREDYTDLYAHEQLLP